MQDSTSAPADKHLSHVIRIDEARIQQHLGEMVRSTVEQTLNGLLDAEADQLCNARRYEHTEDRTDQRAGHYRRKPHTKAGEVELKIPKLRQAPFETAIIERYRRRESSVEEALMEMYLAGLILARFSPGGYSEPAGAEDRALLGSNPSAATAQGQGRRGLCTASPSSPTLLLVQCGKSQGSGDSVPGIQKTVLLPTGASLSQPAVLHLAC
jgi:hypothetical protein